MKSNTVSYKELYLTIDEFRKEINIRFDKLEQSFDTENIKQAILSDKRFVDWGERFDRLEAIFNKHCEDQEKMAEKYIQDYKDDINGMDKRVKPLEKLADRTLFVILLVSGVFAAIWQIAVGFIKKQFNI